MCSSCEKSLRTSNTSSKRLLSLVMSRGCFLHLNSVKTRVHHVEGAFLAGTFPSSRSHTSDAAQHFFISVFFFSVTPISFLSFPVFFSPSLLSFFLPSYFSPFPICFSLTSFSFPSHISFIFLLSSPTLFTLTSFSFSIFHFPISFLFFFLLPFIFPFTI